MSPTKKRLVFVVLALAMVLCIFSTAKACPFCNGGQAGINQVKAGIFSDTFWLHAAAVLAPFPLLAGIVIFMHYGARPRRRAKS